jgi:hypothetical protein
MKHLLMRSGTIHKKVETKGIEPLTSSKFNVFAKLALYQLS